VCSVWCVWGSVCVYGRGAGCRHGFAARSCRPEPCCPVCEGERLLVPRPRRNAGRVRRESSSAGRLNVVGGLPTSGPAQRNGGRQLEVAASAFVVEKVIRRELNMVTNQSVVVPNHLCSEFMAAKDQRRAQGNGEEVAVRPKPTMAVSWLQSAVRQKAGGGRGGKIVGGRRKCSVCVASYESCTGVCGRASGQQQSATW